jgi:hypothetical protein
MVTLFPCVTTSGYQIRSEPLKSLDFYLKKGPERRMNKARNLKHPFSGHQMPILRARRFEVGVGFGDFEFGLIAVAFVPKYPVSPLPALVSALAPVAANKAPRTSSSVVLAILPSASWCLLVEEPLNRTDRMVPTPDINLVSDTPILTGRPKLHRLSQPAAFVTAFSTSNGTLPNGMTASK